MIFIYGYLICSDERFARAIARHGNIALAVGIACFLAIMGAYHAGYLMKWEFQPTYSAGFLLYQVVRSLDTWSWRIFILSLGMRYLNFSSKTLRYANEAVLPFYILHQPVILGIGLFIVQWQMSVPLKYLCIASSSFGATLGLYEFLVRRSNITRFLFGMRPKSTAALQAAQ